MSFIHGSLSIVELLSVVFLSSAAASCASGLPRPHAYDGQGYYDEYSKKTGSPSTAGRDFCSRLSSSAQSNATEHRTAGWITGALGLVAAGATAGVLATDQPTNADAKIRYKVSVVTLPITAALFGYLASGQFSMADASSSASASASTATGGGTTSTDDEDANATCNATIATWESSGVTSTAPFAAAVGKLAEAKKAEKKAAADQADADAAKEKARTSQKKADEDQSKADEALKHGK